MGHVPSGPVPDGGGRVIADVARDRRRPSGRVLFRFFIVIKWGACPPWRSRIMPGLLSRGPNISGKSFRPPPRPVAYQSIYADHRPKRLHHDRWQVPRIEERDQNQQRAQQIGRREGPPGRHQPAADIGEICRHIARRTGDAADGERIGLHQATLADCLGHPLHHPPRRRLPGVPVRLARG